MNYTPKSPQFDSPDAIEPLIEPPEHPLRGLWKQPFDLRSFWVWVFLSKSTLLGNPKESFSVLDFNDSLRGQEQLNSLAQKLAQIHENPSGHAGVQQMSPGGVLFSIGLDQETAYLRIWKKYFTDDLVEPQLFVSLQHSSDDVSDPLATFTFSKNAQQWQIKEILHEKPEHALGDQYMISRGRWIEEYRTTFSISHGMFTSAMELVKQSYHKASQHIHEQHWKRVSDTAIWRLLHTEGDAPLYRALDRQDYTQFIWPQQNMGTLSKDWTFSNPVSLLHWDGDQVVIQEHSPLPLTVELFAHAQILSDRKRALPIKLLKQQGQTEAVKRLASPCILVARDGVLQLWLDETKWARDLISHCQTLLQRDALHTNLSNASTSPTPAPEHTVARRKL